jgi:dTDP-glucose 4,6-dehydratase
MRLLITGGAGFIGSNFVRHMLRREDCTARVLDALTYAGSMDNLADVADDPRFEFVRGDVCEAEVVREALRGIDVVVHFAAETHNDRSIHGPGGAAQTNVMGTLNVLEAAREACPERLIFISTDEVYGEALGSPKTETDRLQPRGPYSASKAGADLMCHAYFVTYGLPVVIHRATNNYGPFQYPEKLIPLFCYRALRDESLPVYGDGLQVRDWLHVSDNCRAIELLIERGVPGEVYNVPGGNERPNLEVIRLMLAELGKPESLIDFVEDRPGHDVRYSLDGAKITALGWRAETDWEAGMRRTFRWFTEHRDWLEASVKRGEDFLRQWYAGRGWTAEGT